MRFYQFQVDGRAIGPLRAHWEDAVEDAVGYGMAVWVSRRTIKIDENLGAEIARIDKEEPNGPNMRTKQRSG